MRDDFEHGLLVALLARREQLIDRATLVEVLDACGRDESQRPCQLLRERGHLTVEQLAALGARVAPQVERVGAAAEDVTGDFRSSVGFLMSPAPRPDALGMRVYGETAVGGGASVPTLSDPTLTVAAGTSAEGVGSPPASGIRYRILALLARGGVGEIYSAHDDELDRIVALKLIQERCSQDAPSRARFLREAGLTSFLEHPGIVPVHSLGFCPDGRPYYTMRLVKGEPFKDAILRFHEKCKSGMHPRARTLELRRLLGRFLDVCNVIAYAHSRSILHRDLKPGNILLGPYGETLVVDWGLAKDLSPATLPEKHGAPAREQVATSDAAGVGEPRPAEHTELETAGARSAEHATLPGMALGTPHYMSPEQAGGQTEQIGPAADVYGLGATLYCLLTGTPPCDGPTITAILAKVRAGDIPPPRQLSPWVPAALAAICRKAMAQRPEDRYATPSALTADIEHWLADEPVSTHHDPVSVRLTRWGRRHRTAAVGVAALLVSAVLGLAVGNVLLSAANRSTEHQRRVADQTARTLERQLYINRVDLAQRESLENNISQAESVLSLCPPALRGWEWSYIARLCHQELFSVVGHRESVNAVAFSPDGTSLVSGSGPPFNLPGAEDRAELVLRDSASGREIRRFEGLKGSVHGVAFSPDGKLIASASGYYGPPPHGEGLLTVWDLATGEVVFQHREAHVNALCLAFGPDGLSLAVGFGLYSGDHFPGHFMTFDIPSGSVVFNQKMQLGGVNALCYSPDGEELAVAGSGVVELWDLAKKEKRRELKGHTSWVYAVAYHPDGAHLASAGWDQSIRIWETSSGGELRRMEEHKGHVLALAFSPDGARLVSSGDDSVLKLWDAAAGRELATLRGHASGATGTLAVAFSPDGTRIVSGGGDQTLKLWDATTIRPVVFREQKGWVTSFALSPDDATTISGSGDHSIAQWDLETGRQLTRLAGHNDWVLCLAQSPDGTRLATGGADMAVRVWDLATGECLKVLTGHDAFIRSLAFTPDGRQLIVATGSSNEDGKRGDVSVWDLDRGERLHTLVKDLGRVNSVAFTPDGRSLVVVVSGRERPQPVATRVLVFDWPTGRERLRIVDALGDFTNAPEGVVGLALAISPDGEHLALDGAGGIIRIYRLSDGGLARTLLGHTSQVNTLAYSPDGRRLASGSFDKLIKLWDATTGEELLSLRGHEGGVVSLAFTRDGQRLISGGVDWTARIWDARPLGPPNGTPGRAP